jgi:hypothetical protein
MRLELVAPCGMNCSICAAYLAATHDLKSKGIRTSYCAGCRPRGKTCAYLKKNCDLLLKNKIYYCYECSNFPCKRLSTLDKRYRTRYSVSAIENLQHIRDEGIASFLRTEEAKWRCPECGGTVCCHNGICYDCGLDKLRLRKKLYRLSDSED